jgi:hypothetical protein
MIEHTYESGKRSIKFGLALFIGVAALVLLVFQCPPLPVTPAVGQLKLIQKRNKYNAQGGTR